MTETLLILNAGSSSLKFQIFGRSPDLPRLATGSVTGIGTSPIMSVQRDGDANKIKTVMAPDSNQKSAVRAVLDWVTSLNAGWKITGIAHRFVHGGTEFSAPIVVDSHIFHKLKELIPLAPLHQPHHLAVMGVVTRLLPLIPQVACFDTAFHANRDPIFTSFALPQEFTDKGIRRYGFHGLSYAWIAHVLNSDYPDLAKGRVVVAHLGNGSSLCAIKNGKSTDTSMGMTALDGLPMGTRCGAIDAGAVLHMITEEKLGADKVFHILYEQSGLKGLSGLSNDVKTLLESDDPRAKFALDYFALYIAKHIAAQSVSIGGIDALIFTGGIGENAAPVREAIQKHLSFLNIPRTLVIPANEERLMAMQALACLKA